MGIVGKFKSLAFSDRPYFKLDDEQLIIERKLSSVTIHLL
jgi:hypothetical protein